MSGGSQHYQTNGVSDSEPGHLINETFQCFWDCYAPGLHCNDLFYGYNLSRHLRERHELYGPESDNASVFCQWNSCNMEVNKDRLTRHIEQKHLKIVHVCGCGKVFSRGDALLRHRREQQH